MHILFDGWASIGRTVIVGVLAYLALVILLRASGKRTLSKMNAFDLVVTVALGSTLATILLSRDVSLASGVTALAILIGLQYALAWGMVRSSTMRQIAKSEPRLLLFRGEFLHGAMRDERVNRDEVLAALRKHGMSDSDGAAAVVLETDGTFSVVADAPGGSHSALKDVSDRPGERRSA
jgi:uncharacterized membrane protein YcaP (DUF421 family)